jgi:hypothetical protein
MPHDDTPESTVRAAVEAAGDRRWKDVFPLIDGSDIPRWRRVTLSMLKYFERQPDAQRVLTEWGARSAAELEALPDEELFARWLQAFSLTARWRAAGKPGEPPTVRRVVLGSVREGDDVAHVVYRELVGSGTALRIATLRFTADGWKLKVDHDLFGTGSLHFDPAPPAA